MHSQFSSVDVFVCLFCFCFLAPFFARIYNSLKEQQSPWTPRRFCSLWNYLCWYDVIFCYPCLTFDLWWWCGCIVISCSVSKHIFDLTWNQWRPVYWHIYSSAAHWANIVYPKNWAHGSCFVAFCRRLTWCRHQMETFSALLAICAGNSPASAEFPARRPVTRSFDIFFDLCLNKRLRKQSWGWWFETLSRPLWRHCNDTNRFYRYPSLLQHIRIIIPVPVKQHCL